MKHKNKVKRLERKQSNFASDRSVSDANSRNPGSYHKPGSFKKS